MYFKPVDTVSPPSVLLCTQVVYSVHLDYVWTRIMFAITDVSGTQLPVLVTPILLFTVAHKYLSAQVSLTDVLNS